VRSEKSYIILIEIWKRIKYEGDVIFSNRMVKIMKNSLILLVFVTVVSRLCAESQWVEGFTFQKIEGRGNQAPFERKSVMSQLKDYQGQDADLMDEATLQELAKCKLQAMQESHEEILDENGQQLNESIDDSQKSVLESWRQFFITIFAFLKGKSAE